MKPWKILKSEYVLQTPYMNLRRDHVQLPNELVLPDYYVVEEPDYGMIFAITDQHEVIMVRQYKHGIGKITLELPAGYFDAEDKDKLAGCRREFTEETGYNARTFELVGSHLRHPTRNTNRGHLMVATGAYPAASQELDPAEAIEVLVLPIDEVFDKIRAGEIDAVGTVASIFFGWDYLKQNGRV